jgi:hypothetical protein
MFRLGTVVFAGLAGLTGVAGGAAPRFAEMAPADFWRLPQLQETVDVAGLDRALLAAAIFHETNRRRESAGLPWLLHRRQLEEAADLQAAILALGMQLTHDSPLPGRRTPDERVRWTGLRPQLVTENLAMTMLLIPPPANEVHVHTEDGRRVFSAEAGGPPVAGHSYASLARVVVGQWMNSPPHRANVLDPRVTSLGCAVRACRTIHGMDAICSVQVFCAVQPNRGREVRATNELDSARFAGGTGAWP